MSVARFFSAGSSFCSMGEAALALVGAGDHDRGMGVIAPSSSVHLLETSMQVDGGLRLTAPFPPRPEFAARPSGPEEDSFRHSGWKHLRARVWKAFERCGMNNARMDRFANCGAGLWTAVDEAGDVHLTSEKCHDRWCLACQGERAAKVRGNVEAMAKSRNIRLITLTLRHSRTPLADQVKRMKKSFAELRRRKVWKEHVRGGLAVLEVKLSSHDGLWHVHLHIMAEGRFFPHHALSDEWHRVTGDSSIVHLGRRGTPEAMGHYCSKYITKPADLAVFSIPEKLDEMIIALRGARLYDVFGIWREVDFEPENDGPKLRMIAPTFDLARRAAEGDEEAKRWWEACLRKWPGLATARPQPPPLGDPF